ncbi:MAG: hypothetical protein HYY84_03390 [Deltaproteobacteria bacterium]|nr:hypothetical protein [Deltaproteobacteria bacterium]
MINRFFDQVRQSWADAGEFAQSVKERIWSGPEARRVRALAIPAAPSATLVDKAKASVALTLIGVFAGIAIASLSTLVTSLIFIYLLVTRVLGIRIDLDPEAMPKF